ncbi:hypothetical protein [Lacinutrix jangbogonensis]|uniref:hypothetical protein n=1 Tax=Lacinutrix jangbogonensis TaxID=1469557 RepID=UPI00053D91C2|nr:hypothetical protein [Lacinutrix jangbogonensis]
MKKILFFTFIFAFSASLSAQQLSKVSASDLKKDGMEAISKEKPNLESQIKSALMKDEDLQKDTINYLKSNPDTAKSLTSIVLKNKESINGIMKSILGDNVLSKVAVDYISENPELLKKVMKLIGK